jgi:hypothetical protein
MCLQLALHGDIATICSDSVVNIRIKDLKPVIAPAILCEEMEMTSAQVHVIEVLVHVLHWTRSPNLKLYLATVQDIQ